MYRADLTGEGARLNGGRWNHPGTPCIYTSITRALSLLEYTCHAKKDQIPRALSFATFEVPDHSIKRFEVADLPGNWKQWPHSAHGRDFGTAALEANEFLLYQFPSVVIEEEMNYLINPRHPDMGGVRIVETKDYAYDLRLKAN